MTGTPSALAFRCWEVDRRNLALHSFNARPTKPPAWWVVDAFATPAGGWPKDAPLVAECRAGGHEPHDPEGCAVKGCRHDGEIPDAGCRCGTYCTRDLGVISDYLRTAREPVLGLIEIGGHTYMSSPRHEAYARAQYARVAGVLLIDRSLTVDHSMLRRLAKAYHVPAVVPYSTDPDEYPDLLTSARTAAGFTDPDRQWMDLLGIAGGPGDDVPDD